MPIGWPYFAHQAQIRLRGSALLNGRSYQKVHVYLSVDVAHL